MAGFTYPGAEAVYDGDLATIDRFMKEPASIAKRMGDVVGNRFIADLLLTGRDTTDSGAIQFEVQEDGANFGVREPEAIAPGGEYPLNTFTNGAVQTAATVKWGDSTFITDESISRRKLSPVEQAFQRLANGVIRKVDGVALSLLNTQVTQEQALAAGAWTAGGKIALDIALAKAKIEQLNLGYSPNVLVVTPTLAAYIADDAKVQAAMAREDKSNAIYTGYLGSIGGVQIVQTSFSPFGNDALLLDTNVLGGIADEDLGGGYQGAPVGIKAVRDDQRDGWLLQARRVTVPYINNPLAAIRIKGVTA